MCRVRGASILYRDAANTGFRNMSLRDIGNMAFRL